MTKKPQKRDNDYFLDRLRADYPAVYSDLQAGKLKNPAEAFRVAGLRKQKAPLDLLRSAGRKRQLLSVRRSRPRSAASSLQ